MSNLPATQQINMEALSEVLISGDLGRLTPAQKVAYNNKVCETIGLNPLTNPFEYVRLNGKVKLYARKDCTEQLRKIYSVSIEIVQQEKVADNWCVTVKASMPTGRVDQSVGAVSIAGLKGEALGNALMKAETKAKRRATLSICGLGMLDETELETIKGIQRAKTSDLNDRLKSAETSQPQEIPTPVKVQPVQSQPTKPTTSEKHAADVEALGLKMADEEDKPKVKKKTAKVLDDTGIYQIPDGWGRHAGKRLKELTKMEVEAYLGMLKHKQQKDDLDQTGTQVLFWVEQHLNELKRGK